MTSVEEENGPIEDIICVKKDFQGQIVFYGDGDYTEINYNEESVTNDLHR